MAILTIHINKIPDCYRSTPVLNLLYFLVKFTISHPIYPSLIIYSFHLYSAQERKPKYGNMFIENSKEPYKIERGKKKASTNECKNRTGVIVFVRKRPYPLDFPYSSSHISLYVYVWLIHIVATPMYVFCSFKNIFYV